MKYACGNCCKEYAEGKFRPLEEVPNLLMRIEPGCMVPAGECTQEDCGALVYPKDSKLRRLEVFAEKAASLDIDAIEGEPDLRRSLLIQKTRALEALR